MRPGDQLPPQRAARPLLRSAFAASLVLGLPGSPTRAAEQETNPMVPTDAVEQVMDPFWAKRELSYRDEPRGPFTAIRADYLKPGESIVLYANERAIGTDTIEGQRSGAPGAAVRVRYASDGSFFGGPVEGFEKPAVGESRLDEERTISPDDDLRIGRFLLSVDAQAKDVGRVLAYDPHLLFERFHGFSIFPPAPALRIAAKAAAARGDTIDVGTSRGLVKRLVRAAAFEFVIDGAPCRLVGYREPGEAGAVFVPFRDATAGVDTYGVGRYLRVEWSEGEPSAIIDFNHATNPWCAYSDYYNCILPPEENHLAVEIRAGEKASPGGHP